MPTKDAWDKWDIICKTIILGIIPITISLGANHIAQSLKTGEFIQSLVNDLATKNDKRNIALIALDESIPLHQKCHFTIFCKDDVQHDPVIRIAEALFIQEIEANTVSNDFSTAKDILNKRSNKDDYAEKLMENIITKKQKEAISKQASNPTDQEIEKQANISETLAEALTDIKGTQRPPSISSLQGVRLVYIQYENNKELAEQIQKSLQSQGISAPGIEYVKGIKENNIRYANPTEKVIADSLQTYLQEQQSVQFGQSIDLSKAEYKVASGQFEIWLK